MNSREKFLIIVLGAVIVLLGGFKLLIEPQLKSLTAVSAEYFKTVSDREQAKVNKEKAKTIDKANKELKEKIKEASGEFFPELKNNEIHRFFQQLSANSSIAFDSFIMTDKAATQIAPPSNLNSGITYPAKEAVEGIEGVRNDSSPAAAANKNTGNDKNSKQPVDLVEMMTVSMQFKASYEQCLTFLDEIKKSGKTMRISSFSSSLKDGQLNYNIVVECFGVVKLPG